MTIRVLLILVIIISAGILVWFGLTRIPWVKEYHILFWSVSGFIILIVGFALFVALLFGWQYPDPSLPEITYGEFPFRLEYGIDGERFVIEDIVVAEFLGTRGLGVMGRPVIRNWQTTLASEPQYSGTQVRHFVLKEIDDVRITFNVGKASYLMGDLSGGTPPGNDPIFSQPRFIIGSISIRYDKIEEISERLSEHGITLINWEYTPPIVNSFSGR